jgi:hypothetical protein
MYAERDGSSLELLGGIGIIQTAELTCTCFIGVFEVTLRFPLGRQIPLRQINVP